MCCGAYSFDCYSHPKSFTIESTACCSCEQIVDELGLGKGHEKFGCSISAMEDWIAIVKL